MKFSEDFNKVLTRSKNTNQYIGLGNPFAKILIIGKEAGIDSNKTNKHGTVEYWQAVNDNDCYKRFVPADKNIRHGRHTWQKYQKLYETILKNLNISYTKEPSEITFIANVFTTELSNLHAKTTTQAKRNKEFELNLNNRKKNFFKSDFIQRFPIIIITANDKKYIETYDGEVQSLFNVNFIKTYEIGNSKV